MSKKRYLEAEMLKEFLRMGMKVGHIHTLRDVENYIDTQPEATPQEVAGQCWRNSKYDPPTEADADRLGRIIVWGAAVKHVDITYWENAIFHPVDVPFWMPLPVAPEEKPREGTGQEGLGRHRHHRAGGRADHGYFCGDLHDLHQ